MCDLDSAGEYVQQFLKKKREQNPEYLEFIRKQPCCKCYQFPAVPHHVISRGAGGPDTGNVIPLCIICHNLAHTGHINKNWQETNTTIYHEKYNAWKGGNDE